VSAEQALQLRDAVLEHYGEAIQRRYPMPHRHHSPSRGHANYQVGQLSSCGYILRFWRSPAAADRLRSGLAHTDRTAQIDGAARDELFIKAAGNPSCSP